MNNVETLKSAVKFSRNTGYFLHDIRNPEMFKEDQINNIMELDKSFIAAANVLKLTPEVFSGFGESEDAYDISNKLANELLETDDSGKLFFKTEKIYEESFPEFKVAMELWIKKTPLMKMDNIVKYWSNHV